MKRALSLAFGIVLAGGCLWLFFRGIDDPAQFRRQVVGAHPGYLLLLVASCVGHMVLRAWRWRTLLGRSAEGVPFRELLSAVSIGYMTILLPARLGELIRPTVLARRTKVPFGTAMSTVAAERAALDLPCILLFLALWLVLPSALTGLAPDFSPENLERVRQGGIVALVMALVAITGVVVLANRRAMVERWLDHRATPAGRLRRKLTDLLRHLLSGLESFSSFGGILRVAVESVAIWTVIAAGVHCGVLACGVNLAPAASLMIVPVTAVGIATGTPGGAGTYQIAMEQGLTQLLGAPRAPAEAAGLVVWAVSLVPVIVMGAWFALRGGFGLKARDDARTAVADRSAGPSMPARSPDGGALP